MRKGIATAEPNDGKKLVIPVKTRTPLEAFTMLQMGHPIDQAAGYYERSGILDKDFYMMDRIDKLHALAGYREMEAKAKADIEEMQEANKRFQEQKDLDDRIQQEVTKRSLINETKTEK